jgi:hypothetical protein
MKILTITFLFLLSTNLLFGQELDHIRDSILEDALKLYKLEKAAWISSDKMYERPMNHYLINGYIPYYDNDTIRTIFYYSDSFDTKIRFTSSISVYDSLVMNKLDFKTETRNPTQKELLLIRLRDEILERMMLDEDFVKNTQIVRYNISVIEKDSLLLFYLLPASSESDLFYMGGDYIVKYSKENESLIVTPQHKSLIRIVAPFDSNVFRSTHSHLDGFSPFITATDICQAKLFGRLTINCIEYSVVSGLYESYYNAENDELVIKKRLKNRR